MRLLDASGTTNRRRTTQVGLWVLAIPMRPSNGILSSIFVLWRLGAVHAVECAEDVINIDVSTSADAYELAEALACVGSTHVTVDWHGRVELARTVAVGDGSSLNITGSETAVIDGGGAIQLLTVSEGATLNLRTISLENGQADRGGSVFAKGSSITVVGSRFSGNKGTFGGGEFKFPFRMHDWPASPREIL